MGRIDEESIKKVLEATDIVDVVSSYLTLKRAGSRWKACCPFHNEKTPSFSIDPVRQIFKCFGCGVGGTAITFVMKIENLSFVEAVRKLSEKAGIHLIEETYDPQLDKIRRAKSAILQANQKAADYFHRLLFTSPQAQEAREYLKSRGFDEQMAKNWKIGWAPIHSGEFLSWGRAEGMRDSVLIDAGLVSRGDRGDIYARFKDRLMFPIYNEYGECVAFSGRILKAKENTGKYVNTPETSVFKKGNVVFGLDKAKTHISRRGRVLLCEGQIDVIACHEAGVKYAVAPLGTAFTPEHAKLLSRYTDNVVLCFDADKAGMNAANKAFKLLAPLKKTIYLAELSQGDDPDSFIKAHGAEAFNSLIDEAKPFFDVRLARAKSQGIISDAVQRTALAHELSELIAHVADAIARDAIISTVATYLRLSIDDLREAVRSDIKKIEKEGKVREFREATPTTSSAQPTVDLEAVSLLPITINRSIATLCELALQHLEAQNMIADRIEELLVPMAELPGGNILKKILEKSPSPDEPMAVQAFIETLPRNEQEALRKLELQPIPITDINETVQEACQGVARENISHHIKILKSELDSAELSDSDKMMRMVKIVELSRLLNSM